MAVIKTTFQQSSDLLAEMEFYSKTNDVQKMYGRFGSLDDIVRYVNQANEYQDLKQFVEKVPPGKVLDVGVAYGVTSAYLALHGFHVVAVEPSLRLCEEMEQFFGRMGLSITVANGIAESMDAIKDGPFDAVVFYSSLHHCDDIGLALKNAYAALRPGGRVFLFEPVLRFYRSKAWFYRMLKEHPEKVGHYGGNEHIYRFGEYLRFLKDANFENIVSYPSINYQYGAVRAPWDSDFRFLIKKSYFKILKQGVLRLKPAVHLLTRLSLINNVTLATRP